MRKTLFLAASPGYTIRGISRWLCVATGRIGFHSKEVGKAQLAIKGRWDANASHKRNKKNKTEKKDIVAPIDEIMFHLKKASG